MDQGGFPTWSPDGKTIVFENVESGHFGLFRAAADGGVPARFASFTGEHPKWSPDGQYLVVEESPDGTLIAFAWCEGRNCDLWVAPSGGGHAVQLTMHPSYDDTPAWSPDGAKIAFTSARAGKMDVYVMDLDLEDLHRALRTVNK